MPDKKRIDRIVDIPHRPRRPEDSYRRQQEDIHRRVQNTENEWERWREEQRRRRQG